MRRRRHGRRLRRRFAVLLAVVQFALAAVGLRVEVAPHSLSTKYLLSTDEKPLVPVYTRQVDGGSDRGRSGVGRMRNVCSGEWKRDVVRQYVRLLGYGPAGRSERGPVVNWLC